MDERKLHVCPLCHGTGIYEEKKVVGPNATEETKKVKCESCEGTGSIPMAYHSPFWMMRLLGKTPIIK